MVARCRMLSVSAISRTSPFDFAARDAVDDVLHLVVRQRRLASHRVPDRHHFERYDGVDIAAQEMPGELSDALVTGALGDAVANEIAPGRGGRGRARLRLLGREQPRWHH